MGSNFMKNKAFIPFYGIDRMYEENSSEISEIINRVYRSGQLLMGPEVEDFETEISQRCKRKYAIAVGSCTDALYFSLKAAGINNGDEVLVSGFSYIASATPILRAEAVPVFVDINPDDFQMNLNDLENKITSRTKAIICVHLFGQMVNPEKLTQIADSHGLILIEDAAQSLGSEYAGFISGSLGTSSCLSFDPTKIIGAFGNGGAVLCDDELTRDHIKKLRSHGKNKDCEFEVLGYNSKMASAQAALLSFQLTKVDEWIDRRNIISSQYQNELKGIDELSLPGTISGSSHTFHKYVIKTKHRDDLRKYLKEQGVETQVHYDKPIYEHALFGASVFKASNIQHITCASNQVLSLPIYPELRALEVQQICEAIRDFYQN